MNATTTTSQTPTSPSNPSAPVRKPLSNSPGAFQIGSRLGAQSNPYIKMLIYGSPGQGKTTSAASSVDVEGMRDVLLISAEKGDLVLEDNPRIKASDLIDQVPIDRMEQLQKVHEFLQAHCRARDANNEAVLRRLQATVFGIDEADIDRVRRYNTIIIDSLTEIEAQNLSKILGFDQSLSLDAGEEVNVAGFAEFRKNNNIIQRIVRALRDLPMHVIIVCAAAYTQDEVKRFHYGPALTGKLSQQIQGFVDIVGYLITSNANPSQAETRRLYVQPVATPKFDAKCRRASFKDLFIEDPTMLRIMKALNLG
ncbi:MAG: AAA family ATPase [Waterburya sp.]